MNSDESSIYNPFDITHNYFGSQESSKNYNYIEKKKKLYIGNLEKLIDDKILFSYFKKFGKIKYLNVKRINGESREFAELEYYYWKDAEKAKLKMDKKIIYENPIKVEFWKNKRNSLCGANIFVKNLRIDSDSGFFKLMSKFGKVISTNLKKQKNNKNYGHCQFSNSNEADLAINKLNGKIINDLKVIAEKFIEKKKRKLTTEKKKDTIFLKKFPNNWKKSEIKNFIDTEFSKIGKIKKINIFENFLGENEKRYTASLIFEEEISAKEAIQKLNNKKLYDNEKKIEIKLYVDFFQSKNERKLLIKDFQKKLDEKTLYLKGLKKNIKENDIKIFFSKYGKIININLKRIESEKIKGKFKKIGYVIFENPEMCSNAFFEGKKDLEIKNLFKDFFLKNDDYINFYYKKNLDNFKIKNISDIKITKKNYDDESFILEGIETILKF